MAVVLILRVQLRVRIRVSRNSSIHVVKNEVDGRGISDDSFDVGTYILM